MKGTASLPLYEGLCEGLFMKEWRGLEYWHRWMVPEAW